jgi:pimeloyl-ACP methyl ester carboxylesterase
VTLAVRRIGEGPRVVLVHGGLDPEPTWSAQEALAERWELVIPWRRGFGASPGSEWIDFEDDASDLMPLLGDGAHVAAFSYGGTGAALAAARDPGRFVSLTLIEPSLFGAALDHPAVRELHDLSVKFIGGTESPAERERFLEISNIPAGDEAVMSVVNGQVGRLRDPGEAQVAYEALREAGVPVLVVSGRHQEAIEAVCDAVALQSGGERVVYEGVGHAAHTAPAFNARFEEFLRAADQLRRNG